MNYYERHIGDYLKDTAHLSLLEHGIYSRLLDVYYTRECGIEDSTAARLIGARSKEERGALESVLNEFFVLESGVWTHRRCDREIARYQDKQRKASASANARWKKHDAHTEGNADAMRSHTEGNAPNHQTPDTSNQKERAARVEPAPAPVEPDVSPTEAGLACRAMREAGMSAVNPGDPRLAALLRQGATVEELAGIAVEAAGKGKGFAWALKALEGRRNDAAAITPLGPRLAASSEPAWRREQRERNEAFAGRFAASKAPKPATDGVVNVTARIVGE